MFGRPRCREWTPLATQQLRLRSLIQIVGYNIRPPEWCRSQCSFYFTLHHTSMSAPFYTSERISSPHPKWKEIDSEITQRMSSTNVVVRVWCHVLQITPLTDAVDKPPDTTIQTWGVYFSGLRFIGANLALNFNSDSFKSNTLVFQMHGGYFCSYKSLKLEVIPPENEMDLGSLSSESSGKTNTSAKVLIESKYLQNHKLCKESRSISPSKFTRKTDKEYSKSHSPVEKVFKQNFPSIRASASLNIGQSREFHRQRDENGDKRYNNTSQIFEHSPDNLNVKEFTTSDMNCDSVSHEDLYSAYANKIDLSETAENYDLRNESDGCPKYRYMAISFLKSEIRPSYNATKLQKLHLLQYSIKKRQEAVEETKERIYQKSALTNTDDNSKCEEGCRLRLRARIQKSLFSNEDEVIKHKCASNSDISINGKVNTEERPYVSNGPRLTLKLNDLLSFKSKPSPLQRAEHVRLTKQLEILRFKKIILQDERDAKLANIRRLKERHSKLAEENQDVGSTLMQGFHALCKRTEALKETKQSASALRELAARTHATLLARRTELLSELNTVFYIQQKDESVWTICDIPLPVCEDDSIRRQNYLSDSVAAGLTAQVTCLAADLLNQPLRYSVRFNGSMSYIIDLSSHLPDPNIPMYTRGGDVTLFRYAMFLLNKCIVQLMYARSVSVTDLRPTLSNLKRLLNSQGNVSDTSKLFGMYKFVAETSQCPRTQSLRSLVASDRGKYRQFNRFKDAVDGQSPQLVMSLQRHRHSRSVGSCYHDDQDLAALDPSSTSIIIGSDPSLYNADIPSTSDIKTKVLKPHNSDSEISRISIEQAMNQISLESKVIFTLGEDEMLKDIQENKLVRISSNNGDYISTDDVKRICSEITDFCSSNDDLKNIQSNVESENEIHEAIDVAEHIEAINENLDIVYSNTNIENTIQDNSEISDRKEGNFDLPSANKVEGVIDNVDSNLDTGQNDLNKDKDNI